MVVWAGAIAMLICAEIVAGWPDMDDGRKHEGSTGVASRRRRSPRLPRVAFDVITFAACPLLFLGEFVFWYQTVCDRPRQATRSLRLSGGSTQR
jgi:hypothetical protein